MNVFKRAFHKVESTFKLSFLSVLYCLAIFVLLCIEVKKLLSDREFKRKVSERLDPSSIIEIAYSKEFLEVAWRAYIISIRNNGCGVGKGHARFDVYLDDERARGTNVCRMFSRNWGGIQLLDTFGDYCARHWQIRNVS